MQIGLDGLTVGFNGKQNMRIHLPCQVTSEQQFDSHIFKF